MLTFFCFVCEVYKNIVHLHILVSCCTCRKFYDRLSLSFTKQKKYHGIVYKVESFEVVLFIVTKQELVIFKRKEKKVE